VSSERCGTRSALGERVAIPQSRESQVKGYLVALVSLIRGLAQSEALRSGKAQRGIRGAGAGSRRTSE
jgi:hypothetical protein